MSLYIFASELKLILGPKRTFLYQATSPFIGLLKAGYRLVIGRTEVDKIKGILLY
jgi:hypothetical protein